jgi:hypothetical protein
LLRNKKAKADARPKAKQKAKPAAAKANMLEIREGPHHHLSVEVEEVPDEGESSVSKNPNEIVEQQDAVAVMDID